MNTLPHMFLETLNQFSANLPFNCSIYFDIWRKALKGVKFNGNIAVKCGFWTISMGTLQWNVVFEPFQWEQWSEMWFLNHFKECEKMLCLFFYYWGSWRKIWRHLFKMFCGKSKSWQAQDSFSPHIETRWMICVAGQWIGFY